MKFKLSKYIIPTVVSMVLVGTYTNIDGLFIGNVMGDPGLAAINIAWPIVAFITALGTGIGVGGSVIINTLRGAKFDKNAEKAKFTTLMLLFISGIVMTGICLAIYNPLLKLMGAQDEVLKYAKEYSFVIAVGALFQIVGAGIVVLLRNDGQTVKSMLYTFVGLLVHVFLDIFLVKEYKLYGVAFSTVFSQLVVMVLGLISFKFKRSGLYRPWKILLTSTAPFGVNFVPSLTLLFTNFFALKVGSTAAVSAYAVMSYAVYTYDYVFQGICDGVQPVLSYTNAGGYESERKRTVKIAVASLTGFALFCMLITPLVQNFLPKIFSVSEVAQGIMRRGLIIYAFSFILKAMVKFMCAYAYSTENIWVSNVLTYVDPLVFTPTCLVVLPKFFDLDGIWLSLTLSQILTAFLGIVLLLNRRRKYKILSEQIGD